MANHSTSTPVERDYTPWRCPFGDYAASTWAELNSHCKSTHGVPWRTHIELLSNRDGKASYRPGYRYIWRAYLHLNCRAWGDLRSNCADCGPVFDPDEDPQPPKQWTDRMAHLLKTCLHPTPTRSASSRSASSRGWRHEYPQEPTRPCPRLGARFGRRRPRPVRH